MKTYHSIIGLPKSGKTTFLAALWHSLTDSSMTTKLRLARHIGDNSYLNLIVDNWLKFKDVPRTSGGNEKDITIPLLAQLGEREILAGFPDLSGESFEMQAFSRRCKPKYVADVTEADGLLLFVTANQPDDGISISDMPKAATLLAEESAALPVEPLIPLQEKATVLKKKPKKWEPKMMPRQVSLVEALQFLQRPPFSVRKRRIAVIISAWDLVDGEIQPEAWLNREMPLLAQYLSTNPEWYEVNFYGVSAIGGHLTGEGRAALLDKSPSERIKCVDRHGVSNDVTSPIDWLTFGSKMN